MNNAEFVDGYQGTQTPFSGGTAFNSIQFIAQSVVNRVATATLVRVVAVTNDGGVSPVGFVDIQPLINQTDGFGNAIPHGIIHRCPYFRLQGGTNAIILDPKVGDTGIAIFADKDLSKLIANQIANNGGASQQVNPDSARRFSPSDALYIGGLLNGVPNQYIQFSADGVIINSATAVTINAPSTTINGDLTLNGTFNQTGGTNATFSGDVYAQGTSLHTHTHGGVQVGSGSTGAPNT